MTKKQLEEIRKINKSLAQQLCDEVGISKIYLYRLFREGIINDNFGSEETIRIWTLDDLARIRRDIALHLIATQEAHPKVKCITNL
jgi:hypothetical protein